MFDLLERAASPTTPAAAAEVPTPVSATDVAHVLRQLLPGLSARKLHMLLYYCQGRHLASHGVQLFADAIAAWDQGPVVGALWFAESYGSSPQALRTLHEAQLATVSDVVRRYGALSLRDLESLTRNESPWLLADVSRVAGTSAPIRVDWIRAHFLAAELDDEEPTAAVAEVAVWLPTSRPPATVTQLVPDVAQVLPAALAA
jgi:uncharacterized phage-associated protein